VSLWEKISARELVNRRKAGEISARELVDAALARIDEKNPSVSAVVTLAADSARERAEAMDRGLIDPGILWGLPFLDKDLTQRAGLPTGAGSLVRRDSPVAASTDPLAQQLDDAGGISVGKSAVCEFGLTSYTESAVFPPTRNPYSLAHGAGGSSGGAAAAVASGMVPLSPGSDGGGSVRIPAWSCGLVGIKPSRGLLSVGTGFDSLGGLVVPGPLATSVGDAALLLDAMHGNRPTFRATGQRPTLGTFSEAATQTPATLRVGLTTLSPWDDWLESTPDPIALEALNTVATRATEAGHDVVEFPWEPLAGYSRAFSVLWQASAMSLDIPPQQRHLLEPMTRYLIERGERLPASDLAMALSFLSAFERATIEAFSHFDVVMTPGLALPPPPVGFYAHDDPEKNFRQQVQVTPYSSFVNVCGLPAMALPVMLSDAGLPVGVQLVGQPGGESTLIALGAQLEASLGWLGTSPRNAH
jgi:amidase